MEQDRRTVLFLCTHNSARSQMAEGLMNRLLGKRFQAFSAGTDPRGVHPLAVAVMKEIGIDLSAHRSKHVREFQGCEFDTVVTVCDNAREACPFFPGAKAYVHQAFPDPAAASGGDEEKLVAFRSVRDAVQAWLLETFT